MKIALRGKKEIIQEWSNIVSSGQVIKEFKSIDSSLNLNDFDVVFDLDFENHPQDAAHYLNLNCKVFLSSVCVNLYEYFPKEEVYGINALPTMIGRKLLEICGTKGESEEVTDLVKKLGWEAPEWVDCRAGLVTPRIICMIINEAYYTVQEGTANREDIDKGMKLGTAYPKGPFEWSKEIGITNVYKVLEAMYKDTQEERYKICPLLKKEYLQERS
jgi:3-hydroxybutyryl-CoA dehydrogenase